MTLREAVEQYILWRQAHGAKFTSSGGILRRFLKYADDHVGCDAVTAVQVLAFLAGSGPLDASTRKQVLRPCRLLALCDQPWSRDALAAPEQRTKIAASDAAVHLLAR